MIIETIVIAEICGANIVGSVIESVLSDNSSKSDGRISKLREENKSLKDHNDALYAIIKDK
ncbi:MAG: hypothetical protein NT007_00030 [Candidatus Kapabacteria bacterium]|nr:hypothetical protein [Candidatus Kapabacteria bacterium]